MTHKKYNPTWDGYMGDVLRGNVGINQLKPQHEFFDAIGLDAVVMRFSAKGQGNGFALRQEKTRYFLHSEWLYHASA
ncbi:hypothetical protein BDE27_0629 [Xenorhabdus ehlersii]|uniref:Uncharacterized protein n=1 Tax=Xenorhabdus ehlersii TaxID=290111 RepID=A0ABX9PKV4_9GAMM|nr:hypothetical protein BDE27_0629 [Xenorhabdus ehlersii]